MSPVDRPFASLAVGQSDAFTHLVTQEDLARFVEVSGDANPLHTDANYAARTDFKQPIVHGMFLGALVSRLIGMYLPGLHSVLLKEELAFLQPVHVGEAVVVRGEVSQLSQATQLVVIAVNISVEEQTVARGMVHVRLLA